MSSSKTSEAKPEAAEITITVPRMRFKHKFMLILTSLLMMAFLRTGFVFVIIGVLPSVVAYYLDRHPQRYKFRTIFACNMAGLLPFIGRMFYYGPNSMILQEITNSGSTWAIIYGAALFGVLLTNITPMLAHALINNMHQTQINRLKRQQRKIEGEWGTEVTVMGRPSEDED